MPIGKSISAYWKIYQCLLKNLSMPIGLVLQPTELLHQACAQQGGLRPSSLSMDSLFVHMPNVVVSGCLALVGHPCWSHRTVDSGQG